LDQRKARGQATILLAMHSFTPVYAGIARPWHIGTLYEHDRRLSHLLLTELRREPPLVVGANQPHAVREGSDFTIPVHGAARGLRPSGIETRQDLITEEAGQREGAELLARIFRVLERPLMDVLASEAKQSTAAK